MVTLVIKYEYPAGSTKGFDLFVRKYNTCSERQRLTMLWTYNRARLDKNVVLCYLE